MASLFAAFEDVERLVARTVTEAASAVVESTSEFPKPAHDASARHPKLVVPLSTVQAAKQAKKASSSWEDFDWQEQQGHWQEALQQLQDGSSSAGAAAGGSKGLSPMQLSKQLQELYQQLLALPDPLPALRDAAALTAKTQELEASNRSLRAQLHNLQQDQTEVTQLLSDFRAEQAAHNTLQAAHKALQDELAAIKGSSRETEQLQQQMEEQNTTIRSLQAMLVSLRSELESSQSTLFEFTTRQEQAAGSASTAEQLAVEEVERLSADLLTLRKDKALLERQLQALQQQQQSDGAGAGVNLIPHRLSTVGGGLAGADAAVASDRQHKQRQQQQQESAAAEAALAAAEEAARDQQHQIALLTTKLAAAEGRLERVTGELARRPAAAAVAAMADQLAALSALTGKQLESEGWSTEAAAAAATALSADPLDQLQPLLQERCSKLERALQAAKSEAAAAGEAAAASTSEVQSLRQQLLQSQQLVRQLEADLLALSSSSGSGNAAGAAAANAGVLPGNVHGSGLEGLGVAGAGAVVEDGGGVGTPNAAAAAAAAAAGGDASGAVLQAVTAQRDRFRARIVELEGGQAQLSAEVQQALARADAVTRDNVALVEKIRFLERYKQQGGGGLNHPERQGSVTVIRVDGAGVIHDVTPTGNGMGGGQPDSKAGRYNCGPITIGGKGSSRAGAGSGSSSRRRQRHAGCFGMLAGEEGAAAAEVGGPEARYMKEYEARLNPFAEFQASESEARLRGMRLHDKALLAGSRLIAGSKLARAAIALYVLLLHGVIMALMYFSATPHTTLYETSGSSSIPSAVAAAQGVARLANSTGGEGGAAAAAAAAAAGVEGLQKAAAVSAGAAGAAAGGGVRLLLRAFAL